MRTQLVGMWNTLADAPPWRVARRASVLLLVFLCAEASPEAVSFDNAMKEAAYAIQYHYPASVQTGINRYAAVIQRFPNNPRISSAKLCIFDILRCDGTRASQKKAATLIAELVKGIDIATPEGEDIAWRFMEFHIQEAQGQPFQDLKTTATFQQQLMQLAKTRGDRLLELRAKDAAARLLIRQSQWDAALRESLGALKSTEQWGAQGMWAEIWRTNRAQYQEYVQAIQRLESTACWAIASATQPELAVKIVEDEQMVGGEYEFLSDAVDEAKSKLAPPDGKNKG